MQTITGVNDNIMVSTTKGVEVHKKLERFLMAQPGVWKLHGHLIWRPVWLRWVNDLSNLRQTLSSDAFIRLIGNSDPTGRSTTLQSFSRTPEEIIVGDDYFSLIQRCKVRRFHGRVIANLLATIISRSCRRRTYGTEVNPAKIVDEIQYLRGAGKLSDSDIVQKNKKQLWRTTATNGYRTSKATAKPSYFTFWKLKHLNKRTPLQLLR